MLDSIGLSILKYFLNLLINGLVIPKWLFCKESKVSDIAPSALESYAFIWITKKMTRIRWNNYGIIYIYYILNHAILNTYLQNFIQNTIIFANFILIINT